MSDGPRRFILVCEDEAQRRLISALVDRALLEHADWLDEGLLKHHRQFTGLFSHEPFTMNRDIPLHARRLRAARCLPDGSPLRPRGHVGGRSLGFAAKAWREVMLLARLEGDADLLACGSDTDKKRPIHEQREGFEQVIEAYPPPFPAVLAVMHPEAEAWEVALFVPTTQTEREALAALREELDFDPCAHPERLNSSKHHAREAKRVHRDLGLDDEGRRARGLDAPLDELVRKGETCGLAEFIGALREASRDLV
ncbi:MAG: hypothetical protein H6741_28865 [Alphaproteobacteria bacterium]|nr:hypothetical protein [Alphaproteobacteria bacterium]